MALTLLLVLPQRHSCLACRRRRQVCAVHRVCQPCHLAAIHRKEPYRV